MELLYPCFALLSGDVGYLFLPIREMYSMIQYSLALLKFSSRIPLVRFLCVEALSPSSCVVWNVFSAQKRYECVVVVDLVVASDIVSRLACPYLAAWTYIVT